ncbi:hypothetical protein G7Y89_g4937 [Cudoniella acicularis]|uniref:Uncharacterized protein n=1 Tax=Cudoniella acicularis TaxID=354080 RepID=A0A8H4RQN5_9HELO|nr:hypothetical protein G7Y89_g4937 [Cudoniella acicularis]
MYNGTTTVAEGVVVTGIPVAVVLVVRVELAAGEENEVEGMPVEELVDGMLVVKMELEEEELLGKLDGVVLVVKVELVEGTEIDVDETLVEELVLLTGVLEVVVIVIIVVGAEDDVNDVEVKDSEVDEDDSEVDVSVSVSISDVEVGISDGEDVIVVDFRVEDRFDVVVILFVDDVLVEVFVDDIFVDVVFLEVVLDVVFLVVAAEAANTKHAMALASLDLGNVSSEPQLHIPESHVDFQRFNDGNEPILSLFSALEFGLAVKMPAPGIPFPAKSSAK